jgi:glycine betaine catabolism B
MQVILAHVEDIASNIQTFWFKPERPVRYEAGQFIELTIPHNKSDDRGIRRWFTLSSSPTDELLSITTKVAEKPSSFKQRLFALQPGETIHMSDTMGDFVLPKDKDTPLLFVAAGIGITPIHSMTKYLSDTKQNRTTHLLYAAHSEDEIAFKDLFDSSLSKTDYMTNVRLTSQDILSAAQDYSNPFIYLSGPEEMVEVFFAELKEAGVPGSRLVTDYFPGYAGNI